VAAGAIEEGVFKEDKLFNEDVIRRVEEYHDVEYRSHLRHARVDGMELDVVAFFRKRRSGWGRTFGFELKQYDLARVVEQAARRRYLFDYYYVVLNCSYRLLLFQIIWNESIAKLIKGHRIGIICRDRDWTIAFPSRYKKGCMRVLSQYEEGWR